jgi:hypothetical protein
MIRYDLLCDQGHEFDAWFSDSAAYDKQAALGLVDCAHCGSSRVQKQMMAPGISTRSNRKSDEPQRMVSAPTDPRMQAMVEMMRAFRSHVEKTAENVGNRFAEEARKIHYKEADARGIYGHATADEAQELIEEGIEVAPLPVLPEDGN